METNDDSDDQDGSCLICHSKTSLSNPPTSKQYFQHPLNPEPFLKDLQTYFLLRHILGISSEQLQSYLRHCPYPGDWVKVCSLCTENYVDKCTRTFLELQEVRKKYLVAREQIIEVVKKSVENEPESVEPFALDICREVRRCVAQKSNETLTDNMTERDVNIETKGRPSRNCKRKSDLALIPNGDVFSDSNCVKVELCDKDLLRDDDGEYDIFLDGNENWDDWGYEDDATDETYEPNISASRRAFPKPENVKHKKQRRSRTKPPTATADADAQNNTFLNEYACDVCSKVFAHPDNLRKHKNECHSEKFHYCSEEGCDFKSRRPYDVKNHSRRHHGSKSDLLDLTCSLCSKVFSKKSHLNYHMTRSREHNTNPNVACEQCDKKFNDETGLRSHQAVVHNVKEFQLHVCAFENCGKGFYRKCHLVLHENSHQGLKCEICGKTFKSPKRFQIHQELHKTGSASSFSCVQCSMRFIKRTDFLRHKKLKHSTRRMSFKIETPTETDFPDDNTAAGTANTDSGDGDNPIESCDEGPHDDDWSAGDSDDGVKKPKRKYTRKVTKNRRVKTKGLPKIRRPRQQKSPEPGFTPIAFTGEDGEVQYRCEHEGCSKIMKNPRHYKMHLKFKHGSTEDPNQEFCCDVCGKSFKKRLNFSVHMSRTHGVRTKKRTNGGEGEVEDGGPFKCSHCDMVLTSKMVMKRHIQITHLREYKFYCELCGKGMVNGADLKYHRVQYHFICAIDGCGVTCEGQKEIWIHHKEIHNTEVGMFSCNECGKLFIGNRKLKVHLELHEYKRRQQEQPTEEGATGVVGQYVCELCGRHFPVKDYLSHHMAYNHRGKLRGKKKEKPVVKEDTGDAENNVKEEN